MHPGKKWTVAAALMLAGAGLAAASDDTRSPAGLWSATVVVNGVDVPFRFEIAGGGATVTGSFFDGERKVSSTRGRFDDGVLVLGFDQYAATLEATLKDGRLEGQYAHGSRPPYPFRATRFTPPPRPAGDVPSIDGLWTIAVQSPKGERAWRFIVRQAGADASATILRVDGDTGTLSGTYADGTFLLSHFSGARPLRLEVTPAADGTLHLLQNGKPTLVAVRANGSAASPAAPEPTDPSLHTRVKDPSEPFRFSFPDLNGRTVTQADPRFQGKVLLVSITGSWCPNCHDEAPFLAKLYRAYRKKGLEIVAFSFEEAEQLADPQRLRTFIAQYGIEYPVLLAGEPDQLADKVPQAENLNAFPTTFILGRDGRVRGVHAGFPSPASGSFHTKAERELTGQVERLLAERAPGSD